MIAALLIGGLALWLLQDDDRSIPPEETATPTPPQRSTARPSYRTPTSSDDYPMAAEPQPHRETPPWADRWPAPESAPFDSPPRDTYQADIWPRADAEAYRFRPLTERDRRRMGALPYRSPVTATPGYPAAPTEPWLDDHGRYPRDQRIYPWEVEPDDADRWDQPPGTRPKQPRQPDWQPPSHRMYPSLDWASDHTLTAR